MTDLLQTGSDWLANKLKAFASVNVIYQRGLEQVTVAATIGKTEFEIDDGAGILERFQTRDYLVHGSDLVLGGSPTLPKSGDHIHEIQGCVKFVYEVIAPGTAPCWRYSDPYRQVMRVHTKHVATETG